MNTKHFEVGTYVVLNNRRAEVVGRPGGGVLEVVFDNGDRVNLRPFALQGET